MTLASPSYKQSLKSNDYKPISDYGIIGNCRSIALVSNEASIDWACLPDFDSPAYFCKILDSEKGGFCKITPEGFFKSHQKYIENTNVLETFFFNQTGNVSVSDFMPISKLDDETNNTPEFGTKIVRLIKSIKGNHSFKLELKVTPDFANEKIALKKEKNQVIISSKLYKLILHKKHHEIEINDDLITVHFQLNEGEQEFFAIDFYPIKEATKTYTNEKINKILVDYYFETITFWDQWAKICRYQGSYQKQVIRSALALKLLTFTPTGAIVAAPTTSLPEKIGDSLNWDYRYTWLRDASFTTYAFLGLGYIKEAERFIQWLEQVCIKENTDLKIMYGIHGEEELTEKIIDNLSGYMNSKPVRVGNEASDQKQFDIYGEVLAAINLYINAGGELNTPVKNFVKQLVDHCCTHWKEEDAGIWEPRYGYKHNTYSKLMCWAGVDRGIKIAKKLKIEGVDFEHWESVKELIREDILKNGYNEKLGSFVAYYGSEALDTSTLNIPIVGFLPANDPRMVSTIDTIMKDLSLDWFILRTSDSENKLQEGEGTFFLSTFWLIDCLSLLGRVDEAKIWLDKIIEIASPLGLYAEEFDPLTKRHLGNYPQAFTHLGLINAVLNLNQAEVFGSENHPTAQAERLSKVVTSILTQEIHLSDLRHLSLTQLIKFFR